MNHEVKKGFTLIELMLAMMFISVLLLGVAMTVIQIGSIYNKGIALKEINQTSRDIASDFRKSLSAAEAITLTAPTGVNTDYVVSTAVVSGVTVQISGRVCLGTYSYIWNTAAALDTKSNANIVWYQSDINAGIAVANRRVVRFVKVPDAPRQYCIKNSDGSMYLKTIPVINDPTNTATNVVPAEEMVHGGDHSLNIVKFALTSAASTVDTTTKQQLYTLEYVISSGKISTMNSNQTACLSPADSDPVKAAASDTNYCNVEQFSLVIRAGNRV